MKRMKSFRSHFYPLPVNFGGLFSKGKIKFGKGAVYN